MPPVAAEPPDTEVLDGTPFMSIIVSGGWPDGSISLDVGFFSQVAAEAEAPSATEHRLSLDRPRQKRFWRWLSRRATLLGC